MTRFRAGQTVEISYGDRTVNVEVPAEWPPLAQDVWTDRDGTEWVADVFEVNDEVRCRFLAVGANRSILPDYLLEIAGPLRLVQVGRQRTRYTQAVAA